MPVDVGTSSLTLAEDHARAQLAASSTFQSLTHTSTVEEAEDRIYIDAPFNPENGEEYTRDELVDAAPFAIISTNGENAYVLTPDAVGSYDEGGVVTIEIWLAAAGQQDAVVYRQAKNSIGLILEDLANAAEQAGHLVRPLIALRGIVRTDEDDREQMGDFVIAMAEMSWGSLRGGEE